MAHRLDLETSGVLIVAKDKNAARKLKDCFEQRSVMKRYIALVRGDLRHGSHGCLQGAARDGAWEDRTASGLNEIRGSKFAEGAASLGDVSSLGSAHILAMSVHGGFGSDILSSGASDKFRSATTTGNTGGVYEACALTTAKSVPDTLGVNLKEFEPAKYAKFSEKLKFLEGFEGFVIDASIAPSGEFADIKIRMKVAADGKEAVTLIRPLKYFADIDASLIECYPLTGRQHQIRLHLFHVEHTILGEPLYGLSRSQVEEILDKKMSETERILTTGAPRLLLHADEICFELGGKRYEIKSEFDAASEFYNFAKVGKI